MKSEHRQQRMSVLWACWLALMNSFFVFADEPTSRFYSALRERQLFGLVEADCLRRLDGASLSERDRCDWTLELSQTYAAHAWQTVGLEQDDLWRRARQVVAQTLSDSKLVARRELLETQLALLDLRQAEWWLTQAELRPEVREPRENGLRFTQLAIDRLVAIEKSVGVQVRQNANDSAAGARPNKDNDVDEHLTPFERRRLWQQVRFRMGIARLVQAKLAEPTSADRAAALVAADELLVSLAGGSGFDRLTVEAQLALAETARLRGDLERAIKTLAIFEKTLTDDTPFELRERFVVERVRCWLSKGQPAEAASWLIEQRKAATQRANISIDRHALATSSEIAYWQVMVELALCRTATNRNDSKLADELWKQVSSEVATLEQQQGGYWAARARIDWQRDQEIREYGRELAELVRDARSSFSASKPTDSLAKFERAIAAARLANQPRLLLELIDTRATLLFQSKRFDAAAAAFRELAEAPQHGRSAATHLLWAVCLGRLMEQQPTNERQLEFTQTLSLLRERFPDAPEAGEASWMLGQLLDRQQQFEAARKLFDSIPAKHARRDEAWAATARGYERQIVQLRTERNPMVAAEEAAAITRLTPVAEELMQAMSKISQTPQEEIGDHDDDRKVTSEAMLTRPQAELLIRLARLHLHRQAADVSQADALLLVVIRCSSDREWKKTAEQLRIVSLAAQQKFDEAERLLGSLDEADSSELIEWLDGLSRVVQGSEPSTRRLVAELQLRASEKLAASPTALPEVQRLRIWRIRAEALAATGQSSKAIATFQQLLESRPRDATLLRAAAELADSLESVETTKQAKSFWRRLEGVLTAGKPDWLDARWHVIRCCQRLGETAEADKLLKVTKLLYPDLGGQELRTKFESLATRGSKRK